MVVDTKVAGVVLVVGKKLGLGSSVVIGPAEPGRYRWKAVRWRHRRGKSHITVGGMVVWWLSFTIPHPHLSLSLSQHVLSGGRMDLLGSMDDGTSIRVKQFSGIKI